MIFRRIRRAVNFSKSPSPLLSEEKETRLKHYILGDLHGNVLKLLRYLAEQGLLTLSEGDSWEELHKLFIDFNKATIESKKGYLKRFKEILQNATFKKDAGILHLIGDVLSDRGAGHGNDLLTLIAIKEIKKSIPIHINYSNHDHEFFYNYFQSHPIFQSARVDASETQTTLRVLFQDGIVSLGEEKDKEGLTELVEDYTTSIKAIDYIYDPEKNLLALGFHAPNGLEIIQALAKLYNISYEGDFKALKAPQLCKLIDQINLKIAKDLVSGRLISRIEDEQRRCPDIGDQDVPPEFPLLALIWNRMQQGGKQRLVVPPVLSDGTALVIFHGHEGPRNNLFDNMLNIDSNAGKGTLGPAQELSLELSGDIFAPCPQLTAIEKQKYRAIKRLNHVVINGSYSKTLTAALNHLFDVIENYQGEDIENLDQLLDFMSKVLLGTIKDPRSTSNKSTFETFKDKVDQSIKGPAEAVWDLIIKEAFFRKGALAYVEKRATRDSKGDEEKAELNRVALLIVGEIKKMGPSGQNHPIIRDLLSLIYSCIGSPGKFYELAIINKRIKMLEQFKQLNDFIQHLDWFYWVIQHAVLKKEFLDFKSDKPLLSYQEIAKERITEILALPLLDQIQHTEQVRRLMESLKAPLNFNLFLRIEGSELSRKEKKDDPFRKDKKNDPFRSELSNALLDQFVTEKKHHYQFLNLPQPFSKQWTDPQKNLLCRFFNLVEQSQYTFLTYQQWKLVTKDIKNLINDCPNTDVKRFLNCLSQECFLNSLLTEMVAIKELLPAHQQSGVHEIDALIVKVKKGLTDPEHFDQLVVDTLDELYIIHDKYGIVLPTYFEDWIRPFFEKRMENFTSDYYHYKKAPQIDEKIEHKKNRHFVLGDLKGNALQLIRQLCETGILQFEQASPNGGFNELAEIYQQFNTVDASLKATYLKQFESILEYAVWNPKQGALHLTGHVLCGSGGTDEKLNVGNDLLTLLTLKRLKTAGINVSICSSAADTLVLANYHQYVPTFADTGPSHRSFANLGPLVKDKIVSYDEHTYIHLDQDPSHLEPPNLNRLLEDVYVTSLKAIDFVLNNKKKPHTMVIGFDQPHGLEMIKALAKVYQVTYNDTEAWSLAVTINQINVKFSREFLDGRLNARIKAEEKAFGGDPSSEEIPLEYPFLRLFHNRVYGPDAKVVRDVPSTLKDGSNLLVLHSEQKSSPLEFTGITTYTVPALSAYKARQLEIRRLNRSLTATSEKSDKKDETYAEKLNQLLEAIEKHEKEKKNEQAKSKEKESKQKSKEKKIDETSKIPIDKMLVREENDYENITELLGFFYEEFQDTGEGGPNEDSFNELLKLVPDNIHEIINQYWGALKLEIQKRKEIRDKLASALDKPDQKADPNLVHHARQILLAFDSMDVVNKKLNNHPVVKDLLVLTLKHLNHPEKNTDYASLISQLRALNYDQLADAAEAFNQRAILLAKNTVAPLPTHLRYLMHPRNDILNLTQSTIHHMIEAAIDKGKIEAAWRFERILKNIQLSLQRGDDVNSVIQFSRKLISQVLIKYQLDIVDYERSILNAALWELYHAIQTAADQNSFKTVGIFICNFVNAQQKIIPSKDLSNVIRLVEKTTEIVKNPECYNADEYQQALFAVKDIKTSKGHPWGIKLAGGLGGLLGVAGVVAFITVAVGMSFFTFGTAAPMFAWLGVYLAVSFIGGGSLYASQTKKTYGEYKPSLFKSGKLDLKEEEASFKSGKLDLKEAEASLSSSPTARPGKSDKK